MRNHRKSIWLDWPARLAILTVVSMAFLWLAACDHKPSDKEIQEQAAKTAEQVKQGAKEVAADAKVAAANAARKANDVASGVKQGLDANGKPVASQIDINSATEEQLVDLPGISGSRARRMIRGRPYSTPHDLVTKGILTETQYGHISDQIVAN